MDGEIFTDPDEFLPGCVSYRVECSHRGMMAMRRLIDRDWGRDWNGGEMAQRTAGRFDPYMLRSYEKRWVFNGGKHVVVESGVLSGVFDLSFSTGMYQKKMFTLPDTRIYRAFLTRHDADTETDEYEVTRQNASDFLSDPDWRIRRSAVIHMLGNSSVGGEGRAVAESVPDDPSAEVRLAAVYSSTVCSAIMDGPGYSATMTFGMNPLLDRLLADRDDVVRCAAASRCIQSPETLKAVVEGGTPRMRRYFSEREDLSKAALVALADRCDDPEERAALALKAMEAE